MTPVTQEAINHFKRAYPTWEVNDATLREFIGGWVAWVNTFEDKEKICIWGGGAMAIYSPQELEQVVNWYQQTKEESKQCL